ncbi:MAG: hypothetical protein JSS82_08885 [Bacteroidetes bacterium]|nr:hypothetical protein [Bacteroidota bacterium]
MGRIHKTSLYSIIFLLGFIETSNAQVIITSKKSTNIINIYPLLWNPVNIIVEGVACNSMLIKGEGLEIKKLSPCLVNIKKTEEMATYHLKVLDKGRFIGSIDVVSTDDTLIDVFLKTREMRDGYYYYIFDSLFLSTQYYPEYNAKLLRKFRIYSFTASIVNTSEIVYTERINGEKFTDNFRQQVMIAPFLPVADFTNSGREHVRQFVFSDIMIEAPNGVKFKIRDRHIWVK